MRIVRIGVDLAKNVFQVQWGDRHEKTVLQRKLHRDECGRIRQSSLNLYLFNRT